MPDAIKWRAVANAILRILFCLAVVFAIVGLFFSLSVPDRPLTAALSFLFVVLIVSALWGFRYAALLSFLAALGFGWLVPPVGSFKIADGRDLFALVAFLVVGLTASYLWHRVRKEAVNANQLHADAIAEQQRFVDLVNSVEGIVWEADAATFAFSFVSERAETILGYPAERWLREPTFWKDHLHPEDRAWAVQFSLQATAQKRSHDFEYRMIAADGRVVWVRDLVTVLVENGRPTRLRGVMVDVSERKRSQEALQEQANLLDLTHDAIFVRDTNGVIQYWNRGAEKLYGWQAEEAKGKTVGELLKTAFPASFHELEEQLMRTDRWEGALVHSRKDGSTVTVASRWSLQRDKKGTPVAILETNNDISERKQAEQTREEIEEQWKAAFESNPTMYFIVDAAGAIVTVNTLGAEQLCYRVDELLGRPVWDVFYEPDRGVAQKHARECFNQPGRMMWWEARKIRKDGSVVWVRETGNAVFLKKRPVLLVVCEDITEQKRAEEAARRSEKELRDVIEIMPAMAWTALADGSSAFVSRRWTEYTGLSVADSAGSGWQRVVHPEDFEGYVDEWHRSLATGQPFESEVRFRRAVDGQYRWFLARGVPVRDEQGVILKWYGIFTDIEDRKRAEQAMRQSERNLAEAQRLTHTGSFVWDSRTREALYLSDEWYRIYGFDPERDKPAWGERLERVSPEDRSRWQAALDRAIEEKSDYELEYRLVLPDGVTKYLHSTGHPVLNNSGAVVHFTGSVMDITERKRAEEALKRSEAYLAEAQKLTHTGSWAYSPTGDIYWSEETLRIWGFDLKQPLPDRETWMERVHPEDRERVREYSDKAAQEGRDYEQEFRIVLPDGTVRHIQTVGHPVLTASGELTEVVGTTVDVTGRKRAEKERERFRQLEADLAHINRVTTMGELTASLAHEVNQPIAAALTNANTCLRWLAGETPNIEEAREAVVRIVDDAKRAGEIISRIRLLFKKGRPQHESININAVIADMMVLLRNEAARYGVSLQSQLAADLPAVMGDRILLRQVVMNLMINAIEAMKDVDSGRVLTLKSQRDAGGDDLVISVSDTGPGLPTNGDVIFNAFFTTKAEGTGMGLAISRSIIESHGGPVGYLELKSRGDLSLHAADEH